MVANLFPPEQIVIACVLGILAGATYYAVGAWLLRRGRRRSANAVAPEESPSAPHRALPAPRSKATEDAIARFIEELRRDPGSPRRMGPG